MCAAHEILIGGKGVQAFSPLLSVVVIVIGVSSCGKQPFVDELAPEADTTVRVHPEYGDGRPADGRDTEQQRAIPAEMARPRVTSRMEKSHDPARLGIDTGQVRSLVVIAREAGQREVSRDRLAAVLLGDDVVDFEIELIALLRHLAILAQAPGAVPDVLKERSFHGRSGVASGLFEGLAGFGF